MENQGQLSEDNRMHAWQVMSVVAVSTCMYVQTCTRQYTNAFTVQRNVYDLKIKVENREKPSPDNNNNNIKTPLIDSLNPSGEIIRYGRHQGAEGGGGYVLTAYRLSQ